MYNVNITVQRNLDAAPALMLKRFEPTKKIWLVQMSPNHACVMVPPKE